MATPPHTLFRFAGSVLGPDVTTALEQFEFTLKAEPMANDAESAWQILADALPVALVGTLRPLYSQYVRFDSFEAASIGGDGNYRRRADGSYIRAVNTGSFQGNGSQGVQFPLQVACVMSLGTARPGPSGKGRAFLPYPDVYAIGPDRKWAPSVAGQIADACQDFVQGISSNIATVVVASSKGYLSPVTAVRVGAIPDTMRSRRSNLVESYVTRPITP